MTESCAKTHNTAQHVSDSHTYSQIATRCHVHELCAERPDTFRTGTMQGNPSFTLEDQAAYTQKIESLRQKRDLKIQQLPAVTEINLAFYDACRDLALQNGDQHGANNWSQMRKLAVYVRGPV